MPYISRDKSNHIVSIFNEKQYPEQEFIANNDKEILAFLKSDTNEKDEQLFLNQSDIDLVRVLEDLVDLLTEKHVILFTDLPTAAQNKLLQRKSVRKNLGHSLIDTDEENIF